MFRQIFAITGLNLRSIPQRWGPSLVIVIGLAGVVAVFTALLAMAQGFQATLQDAGRTDNAIVLRGGSGAETNSVITRDQVPLIASLQSWIEEGILTTGEPFSLSEMRVIEADVLAPGLGRPAGRFLPDEGQGAIADQRALLEEDFAVREFVPVVQRIEAIDAISVPSVWTVMTDKGRTTLTLRAEEDIRNESILIYVNGRIVPKAQALVSVYDSGFMLLQAPREYDQLVLSLRNYFSFYPLGASA